MAEKHVEKARGAAENDIGTVLKGWLFCLLYGSRAGPRCEFRVPAPTAPGDRKVRIQETDGVRIGVVLRMYRPHICGDGMRKAFVTEAANVQMID